LDFWHTTPLDVKTPLERRCLIEMSRVANQAYQRMWTSGTAGNFSIRIRPDVMWVSRSGVVKGELAVKDFISFDLKTSQVTCSVRKPSDETLLHAALYRYCQSARSVVHCHPPGVVASSLQNNSLEFDGHEMSKALGKNSHDQKLVVPLLENTQDMDGLSKVIAYRLIEHVPVVVLKGHGVYAWGSSPSQALAYVEALEFLCQQMQ